MKYKVKGNLNHDNVVYEPGDTVEMESSMAKGLLEIGVIEKIKEIKPIKVVKPKKKKGKINVIRFY